MKVETPRAPGRRRRGRNVGVALLTSVVVAIIVSLVAGIAVVLLPGEDQVAASFIHAQPGSVRWDTHQRLTVLLLSTSGSRTDTMIVASFDPASRRVSLLSIPANLWVNIPGYGEDRISQAYEDGGPGLATFVAQSVTHVVIPYYAVITGDTFRSLVDAIGGVDVPVPRPPESPAVLPHGAAPYGHLARQHLDGRGALAYARAPSRSGEVGRMARQRELLLSLMRQALRPQSLFLVPTIVNSVGGSISTNFPYDQIPALAHALLRVPPSHITGRQLDRNDGAVLPYGSRGADVALPDLQRIESLSRSLFPDPSLTRQNAVKVLNGSGVLGQAQSLALWLRESGIGVGEYRSAGSFGYTRTRVEIAPAAGRRLRHIGEAVATLLHAPLVTGGVWKGRTPVVVVIGRDYLDPTQQ